MTEQRRLVLCCFLLVSILGIATTLWADEAGRIYGSVTDPSGAVLPGARVSVRNTMTGLSRSLATDGSGSYEFLALPIGSGYSVDVEASGFQKARQSDIELLLNQRFRADFQLVLGTESQVVRVSGQNAQVETQSTTLGDVIESSKIEDVPLNGRSFTDLLGLQAGVVPIGSRSAKQIVQPSGFLGGGQLSVNGMREDANQFLINGGDVGESFDFGASIIPTLDSIQEFRLLTNTFDAEYGRLAGSVVNVVTKSGSNVLHGNVFEFLRNEKLDARNYFSVDAVNPATGQTIPGSARGTLKRNQFGGTVGGPILKDRLFFFGDYQGTRQTAGVPSGVISVPSLSERGGDFSDAVDAGFAPLSGVVRGGGGSGSGSIDEVLSTRLGYPVTSGEPYWVPGCGTLAQAQAGVCVFPGQVIPQAAWDPVVQHTIGFIPSPTGLSAGSPFFSTTSGNQSLRDDMWGIRIDFNHQRTGTWSFYYHFDDSNVINPYATSNVPGFPAQNLQRGQQINLGNVRTFGARAVNEFRANVTRSRQQSGIATGPTASGDITSFGFVKGGVGIVPADPQFEAVPIFSYSQLGITFGPMGGEDGVFNTSYQVADHFSKIIGRHTLKVGGDFRYYMLNQRLPQSGNGSFTFAGGETGNDFADYLIGAPDGYNQAGPTLLDLRSKYAGFYGEDSYKVRRNLTINFGLRWEVSQPYYDIGNKLYTFVPGLQSRVFPDAPKGYVFPGDPGIPDTIAPTDYNNFAPRAGIAYSPEARDGVLGKIFGGPGKTSIRVGAGMFYSAVSGDPNRVVGGGAPFNLFWLAPVPVYLNEPFQARRGSSQNPGQRFPFHVPTPGDTGFWPDFLPLIDNPGYLPTNVTPYSEAYNLSIQRELASSMIVTVGYVGTQAHHLVSKLTNNVGSAQRCLQIRALLGPASGCGPNGEDTIYDLGGGAFANGTRPFSVTSGRSLGQGLLDFGESWWLAGISNSNYNALQVTAEKRAGSLTFLGAYTYSKSLDTSSGATSGSNRFTFLALNPFDLHRTYGISDFNLKHNFVFSYSWVLPFDRLTSSKTGIRHQLLAGWQIAGATHFSTGFPVGLSQSGDLSLCGCAGLDYPNYNGDPIRFFDPRRPGHLYFDTTPFSKESLGVPGNANPRTFSGPGLNNWDMTFMKNTRVTERTSLEFRLEFFNVFNHAQFFNPTGNIASANFGKVTSARDPRIGQVAAKFVF
jgi:hypothetical protein